MITTTVNPDLSYMDSLGRENLNGSNLDQESSEKELGFLDYLHKKEELKNHQAFDSRYRKLAYYSASFFHALSFITQLSGKIGQNLQKTIDAYALNFSKFVHTLGYGALGIESLMNNKTMDCLSKILDPLVSNFSSIGNINLAKGIGGGLNTIDFAHARYVDSVDEKTSSLKTSLQQVWNLAKEIYSSKSFSREWKIFVNPDKEKGHTLAFAGHLIFGSSLLGLLFKPLEKTMNVIRNVGAVIANTVTMYHPDDQKKLSGSLFNVYAALDAVQKFLPEQTSSLINNLNMVIYNVAIFMYGDLSHKRAKEKFSHY